MPGALIPTMWGNPGFRFSWIWRKQRAPLVYTSNLDVLRQVLTGDKKASWQKPESSLVVLSKWGANLAASQDGDMWRRHRRIVGPAFNNSLYHMVWAKTLETYNEMVAAEGWSTRTTVDIPTVQTYTTKEAVRVLADSYIVGLTMPSWVQYLPVPGFSKIRRASEAFTGFMEREIASRSEEVRSGSEVSDQRADTFTMLVRANEQETGKLKLSDQEVWRSSETTAHTLSATLALLALHQEIQDEILEHILSVVGCDHDPVSINNYDIQIFSDYANLNKVLATFYEALRLFRKLPIPEELRKADLDDNSIIVPHDTRGNRGHCTEPPKSYWAGWMHAFADT
ncbi:hypothetical protein DXG01_000565 [Tephrocybe rancida]|nr:hypothetical protein DXG01_000565 [Tephrocybe rancida]